MVAFSLLRYNFSHISSQFLEETWAATCEWNIVYGDTAEYLKFHTHTHTQKKQCGGDDILKWRSSKLVFSNFFLWIGVWLLVKPWLQYGCTTFSNTCFGFLSGKGQIAQLISGEACYCMCTQPRTCKRIKKSNKSHA